jgi:hypothetical protein
MDKRSRARRRRGKGRQEDISRPTGRRGRLKRKAVDPSDASVATAKRSRITSPVHELQLEASLACKDMLVRGDSSRRDAAILGGKICTPALECVEEKHMAVEALVYQAEAPDMVLSRGLGEEDAGDDIRTRGDLSPFTVDGHAKPHTVKLFAALCEGRSYGQYHFSRRFMDDTIGNIISDDPGRRVADTHSPWALPE